VIARAGVAILLFSLAATAAGEIPTVQATFAFAKRTCFNMEGRTALQGQLSGVLVRVITDEYPFLRWSTVAPPRQADTPRLIVRLMPRPTATGVEHYLRYYRSLKIGTSQTADQMTSVGGSDALYRSDEEAHPCTDPQLATRVRDQLRKDLVRFKDELGTLFLYNIAISREVPDVDPVEGRLLIVLPWTDLHSGIDSRIYLMVDGVLRAKLTPLARHALDDAGQTVVCAAIEYFEAPPAVTRVNAWDARIPAALLKDRGKKVEVLLAKYDRDRDAAKRTAHRGNTQAGRRPTTPDGP
jgi:hypothetical protein